MIRGAWIVCWLLTFVVLDVFAGAAPQLSRASRPWEFTGAFGQHSAIFGHEDGRMEAWVYPLKLVRDLHLSFHLDDRELAGATLVRQTRVIPGKTTLTYVGDNFRVEQHFVAVANEPAILMVLDIETKTPLEIRTHFERDFQLMWPAAFGGAYAQWDDKRKALILGEESRRYFARVGGPDVQLIQKEFFSNSQVEGETVFSFGKMPRGTYRKVLVFAASFKDTSDVEVLFGRGVSESQRWEQTTEKSQRDYLGDTMQLDLPDVELEQAYQWAKLAMREGLVTNPFLGTGLVAGYRTSPNDGRPGFAWFFGRDALWTAFGLLSAGDSSTVRAALSFIGTYQRADGKIPHEISQSASEVKWFENFPYGYAAADATALYLLVHADYYETTGDGLFIKQQWESLRKAFMFMRSTYDKNGFAQNYKVGHGWIEGGPLVDCKSEFYQAGLALAAEKAFADLLRRLEADGNTMSAERYVEQKIRLNKFFWNAGKSSFGLSIDHRDKLSEETSVITSAPFWFDVSESSKAQATLGELAQSTHQTDWGPRIIRNDSVHYAPDGYHYGSVWPLFTGWISYGAYRYHQPFLGHAALKANAQLPFDGALGKFTEVLSGDYYETLSTASPHQIWSAAMLVTPLVRGLLGIVPQGSQRALNLEPHLPASWTHAVARGVRVGTATVDLRYQQSADELTLTWKSVGKESLSVVFAPALPLRTQVDKVLRENTELPFSFVEQVSDRHLKIPPQAGPSGTLVVRLRNHFSYEVRTQKTQPGTASQHMRVLSESWSPTRDRLILEVEGLAGPTYELFVVGQSQLASVSGAELDGSILRTAFVHKTNTYGRKKITFQFKR